MFRALAVAALISQPVLAGAQETPPAPPAAQTAAQAAAPGADSGGASLQAETGQPVKRIRNIALTGNDPCPTSADPGEIVVCSRLGEPYRIPKELRDKKPIPAQNQSWVNRAATLDSLGRRAGGLPDTCSPVGSGGQTGCSAAQLQAYAAERAQSKRDNAVVP